MSEELQNLLDKFHEVGVKKTEAECAELVAAARKEAQAIRDQAKADAAAAVKAAEEQAAALEARAESAIRQAARDIILELQGELTRRITRAVSGAADQALSPEFMASLIRELAAKFAADPNASVSILTTVKDAPALEKALQGALLNSFRTAPEGARRSRNQGRLRSQLQGRAGLFRLHRRSGDRAGGGFHRPAAREAA